MLHMQLSEAAQGGMPLEEGGVQGGRGAPNARERVSPCHGDTRGGGPKAVGSGPPAVQRQWADDDLRAIYGQIATNYWRFTGDLRASYGQFTGDLRAIYGQFTSNDHSNGRSNCHSDGPINDRRRPRGAPRGPAPRKKKGAVKCHMQHVTLYCGSGQCPLPKRSKERRGILCPTGRGKKGEGQSGPIKRPVRRSFTPPIKRPIKRRRRAPGALPRGPLVPRRGQGCRRFIWPFAKWPNMFALGRL